MTDLPNPIHEYRNPAPQVTCTIDSGTMGAYFAAGGGIPSTGAEADALWELIGKGPTGYTSQQLRDGQQKRYGHAPLHYRGSANLLLEHLQNVNRYSVIYGSYPLLPVTVRDNSHQSGYSGLHAMGYSNPWLFDPLGKGSAIRVDPSTLLPFCGHRATNYEHDVYNWASWEDFVPDFDDVPADQPLPCRHPVGQGSRHHVRHWRQQV